MLHAQLCLTPCDPRDCSPRGSSVHGIFQTRILEWVQQSFLKSQVRGVGHRVCDQLLHNSLIGWRWGHRAVLPGFTLSVLGLQEAWSSVLMAIKQWTSSTRWRVFTSAKQLRKCTSSTVIWKLQSGAEAEVTGEDLSSPPPTQGPTAHSLVTISKQRLEGSEKVIKSYAFIWRLGILERGNSHFKDLRQKSTLYVWGVTWEAIVVGEEVGDEVIRKKKWGMRLFRIPFIHSEDLGLLFFFE